MYVEILSSGVMSSSSLMPGFITSSTKKPTYPINVKQPCSTYKESKYICNYLTKEACQTLVHGLVMSQLDYTNSLYEVLPEIEINKLWHVQNAAAKLVTRTKYDSQTQCFTDLHWLPIRKKIFHKILTVVYNMLDHKSPASKTLW